MLYAEKWKYPSTHATPLPEYIVLNFSKKGNIEGKNTDVYGFKKSLEGLIKSKNKKSAVIIGSGGSTRAVLYSLIEMKYRKILYLIEQKNNNR